METILTFAKTASPIGLSLVIIVGLVHVVILLLKNMGVVKKVSHTQDEKYPEIEKHLAIIEEHYTLQQKFLTNHSIHEIPVLVSSVNRIEGKLDKMVDVQTIQGQDIARLKALSEK